MDDKLTDLEIEALTELAKANPDKMCFGYDPEVEGYVFQLRDGNTITGYVHPKWVDFYLKELGYV